MLSLTPTPLPLRSFFSLLPLPSCQWMASANSTARSSAGQHQCCQSLLLSTTMMQVLDKASKTRRRHRNLPGMLLTTIVTPLKATDQEFCKLPLRCFLGVLLVSSPFAASFEDDVAAFVIDNTPLLACTRICWGGLELWRPQLQTLYLLTAFFGLPLCQAYVRLG